MFVKRSRRASLFRGFFASIALTESDQIPIDKHRASVHNLMEHTSEKLVLPVFCAILMTHNPLAAQTWIRTRAPTNVVWHAIAVSADGAKVVAVGYQPSAFALYTSTNYGMDWRMRTNSPDVYYMSVASSANGMKQVLATQTRTSFGGEDPGPLYFSSNSGAAWSQCNTPIADWSGVAVSASGDKLAAVADFNVISTSVDGGLSWATNYLPVSSRYLYVASSADGNRLVVAGVGTGIYTSGDSGITWRSNNLASLSWRSVACSADGSKLAAVAYGTGIFASTNSGTNWTLTSAPGTSWCSVASSADGNRLVAAVYDGGIYTSTNSGMDWTLTEAPITYWQAVASSADGNRLFAANNNSIYTSYSPRTPSLNIGGSQTNLIFSWTVPPTNFVLQECSDLNSGNWQTLTNAPTLNLTNLQDEVTLPVPPGNCFYRLAMP